MACIKHPARMACRCMLRECACRDCPECKQKACRCCCAQLDALAALSPAELAKAHDAHAAALAHLELALAALDTLPTNNLFSDVKEKIMNPKKVLEAAQKVVKQKVAATVNAGKELAKAVANDSAKATAAVIRKVVPGKIQEKIANSRAGKAIAAAHNSAKTENATATTEHGIWNKLFKIKKTANATADASTTESRNVYLI